MSAITQQEDRQYERKGLIYALIFHAVLLVTFFFWIVLKKTNLEEAGPGAAGEIVNFGFDEMGSGDNNSMDQVATQVDQSSQEAQEPVEASTDDANLTTTDPNAETVVDNTKKPAPTPVTPTTNPTTTPTTKPVTNPNAVMGATNKPGVKGGDGITDKPGNQGSTDGSLNSNNYHGGGGGGGGGNGTLNMAGWHLNANPKVENPNKESGHIVFTVKIDAKGEVISVLIKSRTINDAALIEKCKSEIKEKMEFVKNRDNSNSDENTVYSGTITFVFIVD